MNDVLTYENWDVYPKSTEGMYSSNDLIDAYLQGKKDQSNAEQQTMLEKFGANIKRATKILEDLYSEIIDSEFKCSKIHLKIKDIYCFTGIFVIDEDDYCSDEFDKIYAKSIKIKQQENINNTFDITIMFTPQNDYLNTKILRADGFTLTYGLQKH